jgi:cell fate regulator YaaT (PSP1 superfamily)
VSLSRCVFINIFVIMGCGSGCGTGIPAGCNNNGACGTSGSCDKLTVFDWLENMHLPEGMKPFEVVEVRFKNSRKEFFRNVNNLNLHVGDAVAVEAMSGHDIGTVSLQGELVKLQLRKKNVNFDSEEIRKIYRKARQPDLDKWKEARALETSTMYRARTIALSLGLDMKLSDVEYQGDKSKATFYYTAENRVDFRQLIKVLATEFGIRIEMRQIGARQEASRLGGIGSCGRELCCSTWLTDFRTVNTSAARYQQLSLNPLKLAGQCGKLKCCLNYELDIYAEALREFPSMDGKRLLTKKGDAFLQKLDIFRRVMWFSYRSEPGVMIPLSVESVKNIIEQNEKGETPEELIAVQKPAPKLEVAELVFENTAGQDSLTRFDHRKQQNRQRSDKKKGQGQGGQGRGPQQGQQAKGQEQGQQPKAQQQGKQDRGQQQQARQNKNPQQKSQQQQRKPDQKGENQQRRNFRPSRDNRDKKTPDQSSPDQKNNDEKKD